MNDWREYKISELGSIRRGRSMHRPRNDKKLFGGKYPFIQTGDVKKASFYINKHSETYNDAGLKQSKLWEKGTMCITIAANIADTAILKYPACFPDSIIGFQAYEDMSNVKFIKYYFDIYKKYMESISMGATQNNLSIQKLESLKLRIPNLKIQNKIADILTTYDELIENNNRRIEILEESASELYKEWFVRMRFPGYKETKFIKGIPENWEEVRLNEIFEIKYGKNLPTDKLLGEGYEVFGGNGVIGYFNKYMYEEPKILISCRGAASGKVLVSNKKSFVTNNSLVLEKVDETIFEYLKHNFLQRGFYNYVTGSAQPQITIKSIEKDKVIIPNQNLLKLFNDKIIDITIILENLNKQNQNLIKQRDMLLPRLMNGTIKVK